MTNPTSERLTNPTITIELPQDTGDELVYLIVRLLSRSLEKELKLDYMSPELRRAIQNWRWTAQLSVEKPITPFHRGELGPCTEPDHIRTNMTCTLPYPKKSFWEKMKDLI